MFSDEILEKIFAHPDTSKVSLGGQSTMIHVIEDVLEEMKQRDWQDMNREIAPLKQADDAIVVDTSEIDVDESFKVLCELVIKTLAVEPEA